HDRAAPARIVSATEDVHLQQLLARDLQAREDGRLEIGGRVVERELDVGEAEHADRSSLDSPGQARRICTGPQRANRYSTIRSSALCRTACSADSPLWGTACMHPCRPLG